MIPWEGRCKAAAKVLTAQWEDHEARTAVTLTILEGEWDDALSAREADLDGPVRERVWSGRR